MPAAIRIRQIEGLRGLAVLGVAWVHWAPSAWRGPFPFEVGLFFFFVASGFLVTANLLREQPPAAPAAGARPALAIWTRFLARRALRILIPYYAALALAAVLGAGDVRDAAPWYLLPVCNIHMALTGVEPAGITHFWTLAIQQQFYLLWPLLVLFAPRRTLVPAIIVLVMAAPFWRMAGHLLLPGVPDPSLLGPATLDYLGCGSLLAVAHHRRPAGPLPLLGPVAWAAFAAYVVLYIAWVSGHPVADLCWFQQTFLAIACCGLIDAATRGIAGPAGRLLERPLLLRIGTLSYSLYLFHNLAPFLAGFLVPALWRPPFDSALGTGLRIAVFAGLSWALAAASFRWLEQPVQRLRQRFTPPS